MKLKPISEGQSEDLINRVVALFQSKSDCVFYLLVDGGQDRNFFESVNCIKGVDKCFKRSLLRGILKIFSFIPSYSGLIKLNRVDTRSSIEELTDINGGVSSMSFLCLPENDEIDLINHFKSGKVDEWLRCDRAIYYVDINFDLDDIHVRSNLLMEEREGIEEGK